MSVPFPTYRNCWSASGEKARSRANVVSVLTSCLTNFPSIVNDLDAPVLPVGHVHHPVLRDAYGVHDAEILRARALRKARRGDDLAMVVIHRLVGECAPHPLERAGVRVEHRHAVIAVTVGHEQLVGLRMHPHVRRPVDILCVSIALALVAVADLHDELAVLRELQHLVIGHRLEPRQSVGGTIVPAHPHEALVVEMDPVLAFGPFIAVARSAPGLDETACRVEHHHRRRGHRGFVRLERSRPMQKPDVILRVDGEAGRIAELPFRRHLRPRGSTSNMGRLRDAFWTA